jgi:hypothetical protein
MMSQAHLSLTDDAVTHLTQLLIDLASMAGINPDHQYEAAYCRDQVREQLPAIEALVIAGLLREAPERLALDPGQGLGVLSVCPVGEVGPGGMELVWSRHELPGSCGSHSLMTTVEARACRPIILDPVRPDRTGPR